MLRAIHSNRVEALFCALDEALPPADPFAPSTIVVGSRLVARWLTLAVARSRGIAAGFELVTFDDFIASTWGTDGLQPLDRPRLAAALASVLADDTLVRTLPAVSQYLAAAPAHGDRAGPRRVQLAEHLASLAWSYALTRPDWMPALLVGRVPSELTNDRSATWQAALLGAAMSRLADGTEHEGTLSRWAPTPMLPWLRRRANLSPPKTRGSISVFGMSFFARSQLEALSDLSSTNDVTIYMLDPCEELWDDVAGRSSRAKAMSGGVPKIKSSDDAADEPMPSSVSSDPLPLVLWGKPVRDTIAALIERTSGDLEGRFVADEMGGDIERRFVANDAGEDLGAEFFAAGDVEAQLVEAQLAEAQLGEVQLGDDNLISPTFAATDSDITAPTRAPFDSPDALESEPRRDASTPNTDHAGSTSNIGHADSTSNPDRDDSTSNLGHAASTSNPDRDDSTSNPDRVPSTSTPDGAASTSNPDRVASTSPPDGVASTSTPDGVDSTSTPDGADSSSNPSGAASNPDASTPDGSSIEIGRTILSGRIDSACASLNSPTFGSATRSARELLLDDMRARRGPKSTATEAGVTVLACPNVRREVEVIATEVRRLLDRDATLSAHEVAVWIAGEAEPYLAQAPSAFEAVGVPCHLIDAPIDDRGRIGEAVLALLELPTSTMTRRELLRVMTHPAVLAAHPHVDAADWVKWTERLGIVHGADASAHQGTYLEEYPAHFHWDQGVRRLALGAFMVGERAGVERDASVAIGGVTCAPEEVRPDQQASAATYALIVRSLCADAAWLGQHEASLTEWGEIFAQLVGAYLAPRDEEAKRDIERARTLLAGIAKLDVDGRRVGFREARVHAARRLGAARANRGEMLASGVMIAPLAAMRAIPFRVGFVAGLDEGAFPAGEHTSPLDLRTEPRAGDVSPRDRDRAAFLDVMLCTREVLVLSYVAVEAKSGQPLGPSSVVLELADALAPYLGAASSRDALAAITVRHPLHRFGAGKAVLPAVGRERWACHVRDAVRAHLRAGGYAVPDEEGTLALLAHPAQQALREALGIADAPHVVTATAGAITISIANLRKFIEHPVQAWAQSVLGLYELPDGEVIEHSDEPFHLDSAQRAGLLREVLATQLRDPSRPMAEVYDAQVAAMQLRGQFPVGVFASAARTRDLALLQTWRTGLGPVVVAGATRYGFGRAQAAGTELLPALSIELPNRTVRLVGQTELLLRAGERRTSVIASLSHVEKKSPYHLRGAIDHVVLAAAGLATSGHTHKLLDPEGKVFTVEHARWTAEDARTYLATILVELLDRPHGYLLPFDGLVKALAGQKQSRQYGDPTGGLGYGPIERRDGLTPPSEAQAIAQRRLAPLVEKMQGDHGFERSLR